MGTRFMTTGQAAEAWGVSRATALRWCDEGRVDGARRIGRKWRIPVSTVEHIARHGLDLAQGARDE